MLYPTEMEALAQERMERELHKAMIIEELRQHHKQMRAQPGLVRRSSRAVMRQMGLWLLQVGCWMVGPPEQGQENQGQGQIILAPSVATAGQNSPNSRAARIQVCNDGCIPCCG